jgi:hypothetical protein
MGISDKDYADAIEHQRVHLQAIKNLGAVSGTINVPNGGAVTIARNPIIEQPYGTFKVLTEDDLHNEAMKAPLSALIDMWLARWQGDWVSELIFQEDDFWRITLVRLTGANKLEKHNLANQSSPVYRIIE